MSISFVHSPGGAGKVFVLVGQSERVGSLGLVPGLGGGVVEQPFILDGSDSSVAELGLHGEVQVIMPEEPKIDFNR